MSTHTPIWQPALLAQRIDATTIRCTLCPHGCHLREGQTGRCGVRRNGAGGLETAAYAVAVSHLDAIERKPFFHVRPGARVLTIASPGCSLRCSFCLNHRLSQYGQLTDVPWSGEPADAAAIVAHARAAVADIAMSYSEPSLAIELTLDLAAQAAPHGVRLLWKTNGFMTASTIDRVGSLLYAANVDVKAAEERDHRRVTGASLGPVWDSIARLRAAGVWIEVSTPLVPGAADSPGQLRRIAHRLADIDPLIPWHLLRFTPDFRMRSESPTAPGDLAQAVAIGRSAGLQFVYVERALGDAGRSTTCPRCRTTVIERDTWQLRANRLVAGACAECKTPIPGRWDDA